jgi:uncharacterized membrane protein
VNRLHWLHRLHRLRDDRGSVTPLILGFFLIGLLVVAGAVMASDAFTRQRELQSVCDGAAVAAANAVDFRTARTEELTGALPLAGIEQATADYLARDPSRAGVQIQASLAADGRTVLADCRRHTGVAFGAVIGRGDGIEEHATASAQGILR